ncbi:MAG: hypothetical protein MJA32_03350, partial [Proteobacteria bacterium]|nr:hypothetical protein [Pseudomonadota bacterium]
MEKAVSKEAAFFLTIIYMTNPLTQSDIDRLVNGLSKEAIQAGIDAIEGEVSAEDILCLPSAVKTVVRSVLRGHYKVERKASQPLSSASGHPLSSIPG